MFDTHTLAPLLQLTTTQLTQLAELEPAVKLLENNLVTEKMDTIWQAGEDTSNGPWMDTELELDALKTNLDNFFLIVNGSFIILMQVISACLWMLSLIFNTFYLWLRLGLDS